MICCVTVRSQDKYGNYGDILKSLIMPDNYGADPEDYHRLGEDISQFEQEFPDQKLFIVVHTTS